MAGGSGVCKRYGASYADLVTSPFIVSGRTLPSLFESKTRDIL